MEKMNQNQISPPLIPLEYCTIDRAATLLGCEVEDILHWSVIGAVNLQAIFHKGKGFYEFGSIHIEGEVNITISAGEQYERKNALEYDDLRSDMYIGKYIYINNPYNFSGIEERWIDSEASVGLFIPPMDQGFSSPTYAKKCAELSGFFGVFIREEDSTLISSRENLKSITIAVCCNGGFFSLELLNPGDIYPLLRVTHNELLKMQRHINSGALFGSEELSIKQHADFVAESAKHSNRHELKREQIYAAAIRAREQWPEECLNATAWAATIDNHSHHLFDLKEGEKSPSQEMMARMLSKAMNKGVPYKKS
ncbi:MAG: hypothetical protein ACRC9Y_18060 [Aeromonas veronii]|nr:hypothetical protein HQ396_15295 [Aeromonas hydrophila]